ncbi:SAM-dependent methyltransferase [Rothia aerolata]|uniref:16S RNA G1207 methylase RsmC n=1 Tax=Rothia aerolata TaxID=1812262 RepID=A0A917ILL9_9MICC|nr:class I SAM-dependent methyltransferase [Rothia aerolata]GGH56272.1 16S RNA G1207 methylase RsmC [Rothia aerolata]
MTDQHQQKKHGVRDNMPSTDLPPRDFWNEMYSQRERMWSGKANATLEAELTKLEPGTVLDLGCGEGGDVFWLAQHGWRATGIDISDVAVARARENAAALGLSEDEANFVCADLTTWESEATFDVVVSSFLQSPVELFREQILADALKRVKPGGRLIVLSHAGLPPWAEVDPDFHRFPNPVQEAEYLAPEESGDTVIFAGAVEREVEGPDGQKGTIPDGLIVVEKALL